MDHRERIDDAFSYRFYAEGNSLEKLRILDKWYAFAVRVGDPFGKMHAMSNKARISKDPAEKLEACDIVIDTVAVIESFNQDEDDDDELLMFVSYEVFALLEKASLFDDAAKKMPLYDRIIQRLYTERGKVWAPTLLDSSLIQAMEEKAKLTEDWEEKVTMYQTIWTLFHDNNDFFVKTHLQSSMSELLRLLNDPAEKQKMLEQLQTQGSVGTEIQILQKKNTFAPGTQR